MTTSDRAARPEIATSAGETRLPIRYTEFIALSALLMSFTAMSIDIMLPSLPDIGRSFSVGSVADLPLVVSFCMFGLAVGQLVWGPLADRLGRRPALLTGIAVFALATVAAIASQSFPQLLGARFAQGLGAAVGRIVVTAVVRDLFAGRKMASVMSTVMLVFILVPVLAPALGQGIILIGTWRWVLGVLLVASSIGFVWAAARLPETRPENLVPHSLAGALRLVMRSRVTVGYGIASGFVFGTLVAYLGSSQQLFGQHYGLGALFPLAFGGVACAIAAANFTNAKLVQRIGMRRLSHSALVALCGVSATLAAVTSLAGMPLWLALAGLAACFFLYGLLLSNFNAIAMQPVGQAAGMAASVTGSWTTACGALLGTLIARQIEHSILPLFAGFAALAVAALVTVLLIEGRGGLFHGE